MRPSYFISIGYLKGGGSEPPWTPSEFATVQQPQPAEAILALDSAVVKAHTLFK